MRIGGIEIGIGFPPFIIAEMSGNHNQSLQRALAIVDAAAAAGAHAIKLQTYTADTMTLEQSYVINDPSSPWNGRELYDLYKEAYTPWEWHEAIFKRAAEKKIICFSTPFDESAVDFLEKLKVPAYKIASFENTDHPLLKKVASTGKPVIMSTGVCNLSDLAESVDVLREAGNKELVLLKCTSNYPSTPENSNIITIPSMIQLFNCIGGLSDHTGGIGVAIASIALGARVIEKHFTLQRKDGGPDALFSMEPSEMRQLAEESLKAFTGLGQVQFNIQESEKKSILFKRSIYVLKDIKEGELFSTDNLKIIRPGLGIAPKHFQLIIGKKCSKNISKGTPLLWNDIFTN